MKLVFEGLERAIEIERGRIATLQVENSALFARVVSSVASMDGEQAQEPYSLWEGDARLKTKDEFLVVSDALNLPWDHRLLLPAVVSRMEKEIIEDEELRLKLESLSQNLSSVIALLSLDCDSDYAFKMEWDFKRYLKMMAFGIDIRNDESFLDKLIKFLSMAFDAGFDRVLVFVNLKTFLTEKDFEVLCNHIFYTGLKVLLLENKWDNNRYENEGKYLVDLQFIES